MPFRLAEIRKTIRSRGDGESYVHPKLLDPAAVEGQVDLVLAYFQARLGRKRRDFEPEMLVRFFGDPKVARGVVACLSATFRWHLQSFAEVLEGQDLARLARLGIHTPSELRLHLFDAVNVDGAGFLTGTREIALPELAENLGVAATKLEQLFALDAEEHAVLVRVDDAPEPAQVVAHYNFQVVHALIKNCTYLEFPQIAGKAHRALIDSCRTYGVSTSDEDGTLRLHNRPDAFGNFARWGYRVARSLYAAGSLEPALLKGGRARLRIGGRSVWYLFDRRTLSSLTRATGTVHCAMPMPELTERWQRERPAGGYRGWHLVGTAEPLVSAAGLVVPGTALKRGERLVVLWPIGTSGDITVVRSLDAAGVPVMAMRLPHCTVARPDGIPAVDWDDGLEAMITALDDRWSAGRIDANAQALEGLLVELETRGFIPESSIGECLGTTSPEELTAVLRALDPARGAFISGLGLCSPAFAEAMRRGLRRKTRAKPAA